MSDQAFENKRVEIKYCKSYDYKVGFSNGVFGGLGSNGLINLQFFVDTVSIPVTEEVHINEQNVTVASKPVYDSQLSREVQFGAIIDVNTAKLIINWLNDRISEFDKNIKK